MAKTLGAITARFAPYSFIFLDALLSVCEGTDVRVFENKIYGAKMEQKLDGKSLGRPLCKRKVAGAIPAESTNISIMDLW